MIYWIFDLDNTLYRGDLVNYNQLKEAKNLGKLLSKLPGKKILFTNGTGQHAHACLSRMNLYLFDKIVYREMIKTLKPDNLAFLRMMNICDIKPKDKCIFFEDTFINLAVSKRFGWETVYINPVIINHPYINYSFSDIYVSLKYFLKILRIK